VEGRVRRTRAGCYTGGVYERLANEIGVEVLRGVPLSERTTLRVGGEARWLCEARDADTMATALAVAHDLSLPVLLLGGGSNLLVGDGGFDGLVVHNRVLGVHVEEETATAAAGESFHGVIEQLADAGLAGLGFAAGVPGSVGGAVFGNAGCYGRAIGDRIVEVVLVGPDGRSRRAVNREQLAFEYRNCVLQASGDVVESVTLRLEQDDPDTLRKEIEANLDVRRSKHPVDLPSAGSYFKNLPPDKPGDRRVAAGLLLDRCGCKGLRVGDAAVFERHANIIVNLGSATAKDVLALADEMKRRVRERFAVALTEEVRHVGLDA